MDEPTRTTIGRESRPGRLAPGWPRNVPTYTPPRWCRCCNLTTQPVRVCPESDNGETPVYLKQASRSLTSCCVNVCVVESDATLASPSGAAGLATSHPPARHPGRSSHRETGQTRQYRNVKPGKMGRGDRSQRGGWVQGEASLPQITQLDPYFANYPVYQATNWVVRLVAVHSRSRPAGQLVGRVTTNRGSSPRSDR